MPEQDEILNERESLRLITEMIQKVKSDFHGGGTSAILWGSVVAICGLLSFAQQQWNFDIGFDIWWLILIAIVPQIWIIAKDGRRKTVKTYQQAATSVIWSVYAISILAIILYQNIVPAVTDKLFLNDGIRLLSQDITSGGLSDFRYMIPSFSSIYLVIYAFPTIASGLINRFRPMVWGAIACYAFFIVSLFTPFKYDMLLIGLAGICNWLIPGLLLRQRYLKGKDC